MAQGWSLSQVESLSAAEYARWEWFDIIYGLPDHNAYQAHVCQAILGAMAGKRVKLADLMLRPIEARRLTPEETVGFMARAMAPAEGEASPGRALS